MIPLQSNTATSPYDKVLKIAYYLLSDHWANLKVSNSGLVSKDVKHKLWLVLCKFVRFCVCMCLCCLLCIIITFKYNFPNNIFSYMHEHALSHTFYSLKLACILMRILYILHNFMFKSYTIKFWCRHMFAVIYY